ncbi:MAG: SLBB domain-containing protein, partial [Candidatus Izemoplasmatales bacterium]|nr:SLBB domain-containing protein [Candidatus Izemoplasmatales bacterium]
MKKYFSYFLVLIGVVGFMYFNKQTEEVTNVYQPLNLIETTYSYNIKETIYAEIKGEVRFPGVYSITEGEILRSLIDKAGGLTEKADATLINQAQIVIANSSVTIPKIKTEEFYQTTNDTSSIIKFVYVDVKGEVKYPGVYQIELGKRVNDCIKAAGGLTENADTTKINLSALITDGMIIDVPRIIVQEKIRVYISGEVIKPGYYELEEGTILSELISLAGGFTEKALTDNVVFTKELINGDHIVIEKIVEISKIYVSIKGEVKYPNVYYVDESITVMELINLAGGLLETAKASAINYNQVLVLGSVVVIPANTNVDDDFDYESDLININTANLERLMELVGIGEIYGQRIIDYRIENGYFTTIEEIMLVPGIKQS